MLSVRAGRFQARSLAANTWVLGLEIWRQPGFWGPNLILPAGLFALFALQAIHRGQLSAFAALGQFAVFALFGVALVQFGIGIAMDRTTPWELFIRTLPARPATRLLARALTGVVFTCAGLLPVLALSVLATDVSLSAPDWGGWLVKLAAGAVPFGLLGIALGYSVRPKVALPLANLLYLGLAYLGGLWIPPGQLPAGVRQVAPFSPTGQYRDLLVTRGIGGPARDWLWLVAWTAIFATLAWLAYRRDEGVRYR